MHKPENINNRGPRGGSSAMASGAAALVVLVSCAGCFSPAQSKSLAVSPSAPYRIGPEDVIEVTVWNNDKVSRTVPVRPDGVITLPLINDIKAAGHTPMSLRDALTEKLAEFIPSAEVSVIVREVNSSTVSVIGEVTEPGRYSLRAPTRLLDVLALAGGLGEFASTDVFILRPQEDGSVERIPVSVDRATRQAEAHNPYILAGDTVVVP